VFILHCFIDGALIDRALNGDREATIDLSKIIVSNSQLLNEWLLIAIEKISNKSTPNEAFSWVEKMPSQEGIDLYLTRKKAFKRNIEDAYNHFLKNKQDDDLAYYIGVIFESLLSGKSPNDAFCWNQKKKGRRTANINVYRDWDIQSTVKDLLNDEFSREDACRIVGEVMPYYGDYGLVKRVSRGIKSHTDMPTPDDIFPLHPAAIENKDTGIKGGILQENIDQKKLTYKPLKSNK
jgi:hypothetical protein